MNIKDVGERRIKTRARAIIISRSDNVALVLSEVHVGDEVILSPDWSEIAIQTIPPGHEIAIREVESGQPIIKSGKVIGVATRRIYPGEHVYIHNLLAA